MNIRWKASLALALVYLGILFSWNWVWGVLFLLWTIPALGSGRIHLIEEVDRGSHPVLYWLILATWIFLSLYLIWIDLAQTLGGVF